jgi:hypothetical protein
LRAKGDENEERVPTLRKWKRLKLYKGEEITQMECGENLVL